MKVEKALTVVFALLILSCGEETLEVRVSHPEDGALVAGILRIVADAGDNVVGVSFYIDDSCVHFTAARPFIHVWNTFGLPDSSAHYIYAVVEDRKGNEASSDTVSVEIFNDDMLFADGFEPYLPYSYPSAGWFEIWPGAGTSQTYVESGIAHSGAQGFRMSGLADQVRTDGTELALAGVDLLMYEISLMIPQEQQVGALFGFFMLLNPQVGAIYNGIWFCPEDSLIYARGVIEDSTGYTWKRGKWYTVCVTLDYIQLRMNVWLDNEQIVFDLPAIPRDWADTFALATEYGTAGIVYYDNVAVKGSSQARRH